MYDASAKSGNGGGYYSLSLENLADIAKTCQASGACHVDSVQHPQLTLSPVNPPPLNFRRIDGVLPPCISNLERYLDTPTVLRSALPMFFSEPLNELGWIAGNSLR